ncbi:MAG TPA: hypothetical protein VNI83_15360 [Vicinamibacterales bacterium]|nr:hypothetical protein [Vicinamibacterales bacterium]
MLCRTCRSLKGPWWHRQQLATGPYWHPCECPDPPPPNMREWLDEPPLRQLVGLCRCCGVELYTDGHKFAVWFCKKCGDFVREFNDRQGYTLIPLGRHSVMARLLLPLRDAKDDAKLRAFVSSFDALCQRMGRLQAWAKENVASNVERLGFSPEHDIPLVLYLERGVVVEKAEAFARLRAFFLASGDGEP